MNKLAFTVAFGPDKYQYMAQALKRSVEKYSPGVDFVILGEGLFTPLNEGLPRDRPILPKDRKYPKIEILSNLKDPNTQYMYIDADCIVTCDISPLFELIHPDILHIEYVYNTDGNWAGVKGLPFPESCQKVGIEGVKPYSLNSGFMMWQGEMPCFKKALEIIKTYNIDDPKGRIGDEYYFCLGVQLSGTRVEPLDYKKIKLGKYWNGLTYSRKGKLLNDFYPDNDREIIHYGNFNYENPVIRKHLEKFGVPKITLSERIKFYKIFWKWRLKRLLLG